MTTPGLFERFDPDQKWLDRFVMFALVLACGDVVLFVAVILRKLL